MTQEKRYINPRAKRQPLIESQDVLDILPGQLRFLRKVCSKCDLLVWFKDKDDDDTDIKLEIILAIDKENIWGCQWEISLLDLVDYVIDGRSAHSDGTLHIDVENEFNTHVFPQNLAEALHKLASRIEAGLNGELTEEQFNSGEL